MYIIISFQRIEKIIYTLYHLKCLIFCVNKYLKMLDILYITSYI